MIAMQEALIAQMNQENEDIFIGDDDDEDEEDQSSHQ